MSDSWPAICKAEKAREALLSQDLPQRIRDTLQNTSFKYSEYADTAYIDLTKNITLGPKIINFSQEVVEYIILHEVTHEYKGHLEHDFAIRSSYVIEKSALSAFMWNLAADFQVDYYLSRFLGKECPVEIHGPGDIWDNVLMVIDANAIMLFGEIQEPPFNACLKFAEYVIRQGTRPTVAFVEGWQHRMDEAKKAEEDEDKNR